MNGDQTGLAEERVQYHNASNSLSCTCRAYDSGVCTVSGVLEAATATHVRASAQQRAADPHSHRLSSAVTLPRASVVGNDTGAREALLLALAPP